VRVTRARIITAFVFLFGLSAQVGHDLSALQQRELPPLLYVCPHHADHLQETPGRCPMPMDGTVCKMQLVPVRIEADLWYSCPLHAAVLRPQPGTCPLDRRPLMPVTVTVHWTCKANPYEQLMEPGRCADGSAREEKHEIRAHGDHNPRHGGQFYMAADSWHHIEGTYPQAGLIRVYFYDNLTQPIDAKAFTGRLVLREEFDPATKLTKELDVRPLRRGRDANTLEADLTNDRLPLKATLKVRFTPNAAENRVDFLFTEFTKDPSP
jgi:hypothetical protein